MYEITETAHVHERSQRLRQLPRQLPRLRHARPKRLDAEASCRGDGLGTERRVRVGEVQYSPNAIAERTASSDARLTVVRCVWSATSMARDERKRATCMGVGGRDGVAPLASGNAVVCERGRRDDLHVLLT